MKNKLTTVIVCVLSLAEALLALLSWLLSTNMTNGVRSLLSSEGIRWFLGEYVQMLQSPVLSWLLLLAASEGLIERSKIFSRPTTYREWMGLRVSLAALLIYMGVILMLTVFPHAILLSATGTLFPSPFSRAWIPLLAFGLLLISVAYGLTVRTFTSYADIVQSMTWGLAKASPLFLIYILAIQFYESLRFVFF